MKTMTNRDWIAFAVDFAEAIIKVDVPEIDLFQDEYLVSASPYGFLGNGALLRCRHFNFYFDQYLDECRGKSIEELEKEQFCIEATEENLDLEDETVATLCCTVHHIMWDLSCYGQDPYGVADMLWAITDEIGEKYGVLFDFGWGNFSVSVSDEEDSLDEEE